MKFFLDTEFIEDGKTIDLISIGIVCEDGDSFYAQNLDCELDKAGDWVRENVLPKLYPYGNSAWMRHSDIAIEVQQFILRKCNNGNFYPRLSKDHHNKPEFWGWYADYDWVVFAQLFGRMVDLPEGYPMMCMDLKQACIMAGDTKIPFHPDDRSVHNALVDAEWNRQVYDFLFKRERSDLF